MKSKFRYLVMGLLLVIGASPSFAHGHGKVIVVGGFYPRCDVPVYRVTVFHHHHLLPRHRYVVIRRFGHPHVRGLVRSIGITRVYPQ
jgi:hypothetical protein